MTKIAMIVLVLLMSYFLISQAKADNPPKYSPNLVLSRGDMVQTENAIQAIRKRADDNAREADAWQENYEDLANCVMKAAEQQIPALTCLGDPAV